MAYATASDVAVRWARTPSDDELALIDVRLNDVERMIRRRIPDLDDQIADGSIDEDDVRQVESDVVLRVIRNPEGFISETDGNYTYQLSHSATAARLEIYPEEWKLLGYTIKGGMFTLIPSFSTDEG